MPEPRPDLLLFERLLARAAPLSAAGVARRETMRGALVAAVVRRRLQRRAIRVGLAAAALVLALGFALGRAWSRPSDAPRGGTPAHALAHADFATVRDDTSVAAAWRVAPALGVDVICRGDARAVDAWVVRNHTLPANALADDAEILRLLASADRKTGLVRGPRGVYFTADIFDALDSDGP